MLALVALCVVIITDSLSAQDDKTQLNELQKLKAENFQLKVKVASCNATLTDRENRLTSIELTNEQSKLVEEFRKSLNAQDTDTFDWSTFTFKPSK